MQFAKQHDELSSTMDPAAPWIETPEDDPARMRWFSTLTNPLGTTSRLHFTRAWTALFFARVLALGIPFAVFMVLSAADPLTPDEEPRGFGGLFLLTIFVSTVLSFVLHMRRLNDVRRSPLWAGLVAIPLIAGLGGFLVFSSNGAADYDVALETRALVNQGISRQQLAIDFERRDVYQTLAQDVLLRLAVEARDAGADDGGIIRAARRAPENRHRVDAALQQTGLTLTREQRETFDRVLRREARALSPPWSLMSEFLDKTSDGALRRARRDIDQRWVTHLPRILIDRVSQREYAIMTGVPGFFLAWALPSLFAMLWSVFWLGRLPTGGGTIADRMKRMSSKPSQGGVYRETILQREENTGPNR